MLRTMYSKRRIRALDLITFGCLSLGLAMLSGKSSAEEEAPSSCGPIRLGNHYGPYDYRKDLDKLPIVMSGHFTPEVENLIRGKSTSIGGDLDYTLRAFPNHPRALVSMMRLGEKLGLQRVRPTAFTVECYFDRAIRFQPDDYVVRMIYATFLQKNARTSEALAQLDTVSRQAGDNPITHKNLSLLYFDLKAYDKALIHAHAAYELGFQDALLREKLKSVGRWSEPQDSASTNSDVTSPEGK